MTWKRVIALAAIHALLFACSFHPLALWPLAWICVVPELFIIARGSMRQAIWGVGLSHFLHGLWTVYWLAYTYDFSAGFPWMKETMGAGPAPWIGTSVGFGLYGLFYGWLAKRLVRTGLPVALWLPILWTGIECIQGKFFFFAFPWMWLGYSQYAVTPLIQCADIGGSLLVSFLVAAGNGAIFDVVSAPQSTLRRRALRTSGLGFLALLSAALVYGVVRPTTIEILQGPQILAIQPSIIQVPKTPAQLQAIKNRLTTLIRLTGKAPGLGTADLILWPETIVPEFRTDDVPPRYVSLDQAPAMLDRFRSLSAPGSACFFVGTIHEEKRDGEDVGWNCAYWITPDGKPAGRYDKIYLAPLSEFTPFHDTWPWLHRLMRETFVPPDFTQFERGKDVAVFPLPSARAPGGAWRVAGSICFDITFSAATHRAVENGADIIANVSNYAWFVDSAELDLARAQTIFRAIETRRGIVCDVNGGITHFVEPSGAVTDLVSPEGKRKEFEGTMLHELRTSHARTVFCMVPNDVFGWSCMVVAAILALGLRRRGAAS